VLSALLQAGGVPEAGLPEAYQAVDKLERMRREEVMAQLAGAGLGSPAVETVFRVAGLRGLPAVETEFARNGSSSATAAGDLEPLRRVVAALDAMGLGDFVEVDLSIVRGLAYYTGTVFELFDAGRTLRAICGGGRYDNLLSALGGVELPALGFGMGDVVLSELLKERGLVPAVAAGLDVFVVGVTPDDVPHLLALAHELRDGGLRVEYTLGSSTMRKQLELADARRARYAVVIGPDDRARGEVILRDLEGGSQRALARDAVVAEIAGIASQGAA
jgi:histidyl-tRNA synthetase